MKHNHGNVMVSGTRQGILHKEWSKIVRKLISTFEQLCKKKVHQKMFLLKESILASYHLSIKSVQKNYFLWSTLQEKKCSTRLYYYSLILQKVCNVLFNCPVTLCNTSTTFQPCWVKMLSQWWVLHCLIWSAASPLSLQHTADKQVWQTMQYTHLAWSTDCI